MTSKKNQTQQVKKNSKEETVDHGQVLTAALSCCSHSSLQIFTETRCESQSFFQEGLCTFVPEGQTLRVHGAAEYSVLQSVEAAVLVFASNVAADFNFLGGQLRQYGFF